MEYVTTIKIGDNFEEIIESFNDNRDPWNVSETLEDWGSIGSSLRYGTGPPPKRIRNSKMIHGDLFTPTP